MTTRIHPISEINQRAKEVLVKEIGVVDTVRFLNQFRVGNGNYTAERDSLFKEMTARQIIAEIKARRTQDHE